MKNSIPAFCALLLAVAPAASAAPIRVFLQGGQSNADGRADVAGLPAALQQPQADVPFYYYFTGGPTTNGNLGTFTTLRPGASTTGANTFGPEVTFGRALGNAVAGTGATVALLKYAHGGTTLASNWKAGGDATTTNDGPDYVTFQTVVNNGLAALTAANPGAAVQIAGMIWVQGESDIDGGSTTAAPYAANLTNFISDVRKTFGANLPFLLSRISANQTIYSNGSATVQANYNTVRGAQASVAASVPGVYMIDTDPASFSVKSDNLHFDANGQQALGTAFAQSALAAGAVPEPASGVALCGLLGLLLRRRRRRAAGC